LKFKLLRRFIKYISYTETWRKIIDMSLILFLLLSELVPKDIAMQMVEYAYLLHPAKTFVTMDIISRRTFPTKDDRCIYKDFKLDSLECCWGPSRKEHVCFVHGRLFHWARRWQKDICSKGLATMTWDEYLKKQMRPIELEIESEKERYRLYKLPSGEEFYRCECCDHLCDSLEEFRGTLYCGECI
jgi:hypothetical protein